MIPSMMKMNQNLSAPNQYTLGTDLELIMMNSSIMCKKMIEIDMKRKAMCL